MVLKAKKFESPEAGDTAVLDAATPAAAAAETTVGVVEAEVAATPAATAAAAAAIDTASDTAAAAIPAAASTTAIAPVAPKALSTVVGKKFAPALSTYSNVFDPSSLAFNTFNRVTVDLGGFNDADKKELGNDIVLQLMSFNERYAITPGVQDDDATQHVRYSLDGKTIDGTGESVLDYLKVLREVEGYTNADVKKYLALYGFLVKQDDTVIDPADRQIVEIQVPPMSVAYFTRFQIETGVKISQGVLQASDLIGIKVEKAQGKTTKYAAIKFSYVKGGSFDTANTAE